MRSHRGTPRSRWIVALVTLLVVTSGLAVAQSDDQSDSDQPEWADAAFDQFAGMVAVYNESIAAVDLGVAGDQLENERVNLVVTDADGAAATFSFRLDGQLRMTELDQGPRSDATLRMSTDRSTFDSVLGADNPAVAFRDAVADGDVELSGIGTTNAVKWVVINTVADLARSLGLF